MAMIECPECGKSISDKAATCPGCGCPIASVNDKPQAAGAKCPKCGSTNISFQVVQQGSVGASTNKVVIQEAKKSKGCLYWCIVGWWLQPIVWMFTAPFKLLFGGKRKSGLNVNASKMISKTKGICQNCGYTWVK